MSGITGVSGSSQNGFGNVQPVDAQVTTVRAGETNLADLAKRLNILGLLGASQLKMSFARRRRAAIRTVSDNTIVITILAACTLAPEMRIAPFP